MKLPRLSMGLRWGRKRANAARQIFDEKRMVVACVYPDGDVWIAPMAEVQRVFMRYYGEDYERLLDGWDDGFAQTFDGGVEWLKGKRPHFFRSAVNPR